MEYKGYIGKVELDEKSSLLRGEVINRARDVYKRQLPMLLVGIVTFVALGQVISGVAQTVAVASMAGQLAYFALLFVTDMIMPLSVMPAWIQRVAVYLPSYAVVQLVRPPLMLTELDPALGRNLLLAAVYIVAAGVVAARLFRWSPRS